MGGARRQRLAPVRAWRLRTAGAGGPAVGLMAVVLMVVLMVGVLTTAASALLEAAPVSAAAAGPAPAYRCGFNTSTSAFTGADGTASTIGWLGDHFSVVTCLGGTFMVQDGQGGYFINYGFGIYDGQRTTWSDADGYLPAQVTAFRAGGARVAITEFADRVVVGGHPFVAVYSRVRVGNPTTQPLRVDPEASPGLVVLARGSDLVPPHGAVDHDYVVVADRFGSSSSWPSAQAIATAGSFDQHYAHMRSFWNAQLRGIAGIDVPDPSLVDAYKSGFITTQLIRSGEHLDTGVNGYQSEFSHDVVGILSNLFTQGSFAGAHALLIEARSVVGSQASYVDGLWTYPLPWAIYLLKTGDVSFVRENFASSGPGGAANEPSIKDAAHAIASDRTGPLGTMEATDDIDTDGYWTTDDFEALLGLAAYRYIAGRVDDQAEATWAAQQYTSLLDATNTVLEQTITENHLDYLPCSLLQPNTANRCSNPMDANWTSPFGFGSWAWEGSLLGAPVNGPGKTMIDATYRYGFGRLQGLLPPDTTGGFPDDYYSSAYNAANGMAGLAGGPPYRDQGILDYEFMLANSQSGPFSWWESSTAPDHRSPWIGNHPGAGQGSSPHAWGIAGANKVLLDSLVAQTATDALVIGRGVPSPWLANHRTITVTNFPTTDGRRIGLTITSTGKRITLTRRGAAVSGPVFWQLPVFVGNVAKTSSGAINEMSGTVALAPAVRSVTVTLRRGVSN